MSIHRFASCSRCFAHALGLSLLVLLHLPETAHSQAPEAGYVFPPAVVAGSEAEVQIGGYDFTADLQYFTHDERVSLTTTGELGEFQMLSPPFWFGEKGRSTAMPIPRETTAKIRTPKEFPEGLVRWQVANANGASSCGVLYVSNGSELVESRFRDEPQPIKTLPVGVSGRLGQIAEIDRYQITLPKPDLVHVELFARRLGANFHGVLEVVDPNGRTIASVADSEGRDVTLTFPAEAKTTYCLKLHDLDFRGHRSFVYRLGMRRGPRVLAASPAKGQRGSQSNVQLIGYGLKSKDLSLEQIAKKVKFSGDGSAAEQSLPLAVAGVKTSHAIPLTDVAIVEPIAEETKDSPRLLPVPCGETLRWRGEAMRRSFLAAKGQRWTIVAECQAFGGRHDFALTIVDEAGKTVTANDDANGDSDPALELNVPADGRYTCVIEDVAQTPADAASIVHLSIRQAAPGYSLTIPERLNVPLGGQAALTVTARREGGFADEISIHLEGLPAGLTVAGEAKIPRGKNTAKINVKSDPAAAVTAGLIQVVGKANVRGALVTKPAIVQVSGNLAPRNASDRASGKALVAVTMKAPFSLELIDKNRQRAVHRGTTYPAPFVVKREESFQGEVRLQMAAKQSRHRQGIFGPIVKAAPGVERIDYPCFMPEWLETDRTSRMTVIGLASVADPKGNPRMVAKSANARVTMILEGALLKIAHAGPELTATIGAPIEIPFQLSRTSKLAEKATVELIPPPQLAKAITTTPIEVPPGQSQGVIRANASPGERVAGRWPLTLRATAWQDGKWRVVSQCEVEIELTDAK